jgi:cardiolipin synthase
MTSNILTIPNLLTFVRMGLIPVFAILLYYGYYHWALAVFLFAGATDWLDGIIARRFQQSSALGTILDPIADKLLMTTAFILLTLPNIFPPTRHLPVPFWVTMMVIGRDILIVVVAGAIHIVTGFRDFKPSMLGKLSTLVQVTAVGLILSAPFFPNTNSFYLPVVYATVSTLAFVSGIHYIFFVARLMNESPADAK